MRRGFSLVELVMVMAVLGIVAIIAVPRLSAAQSGSRLAAAEKRLVNEFVAVGALARARGRAHTIQIHLVSSEFRVYEGTPDNLGGLVRTVNFSAQPYAVSFTDTTIGHPGGLIAVDAFGMYDAVAKVRMTHASTPATVDLHGPLKGAAVAVSAESADNGEPRGRGLIDALGGLLGGGG